MPDETSGQGSGKTIAAVGSAAVGGAISQLVVKILQHDYPWMIDSATASAIEVISVALIVWLATWATPHRIGGNS